VQAVAVLLAVASASLYALSTALQAIEARVTPRGTALRASLIARLVRRPLWLIGGLAGVLAWPIQAVALGVGSVGLVQPTLGAGLIVLLLLGVTVLHERVGLRELAGVAAIVAAVAALAFAAPAATGAFTTPASWGIGLALVVVAPAPYLLRAAGRAGGRVTTFATGLAWAWTGLGTALLDDAIGGRHWAVAVGWALGVGVTSWGALLTEMTALQTWPATRAIPIAFGCEMLLPSALAPLLTDEAPRGPALFAIALVIAGGGALLLGGSRAVARAAQSHTAP